MKLYLIYYFLTIFILSSTNLDYNQEDNLKKSKEILNQKIKLKTDYIAWKKYYEDEKNKLNESLINLQNEYNNVKNIEEVKKKELKDKIDNIKNKIGINDLFLANNEANLRSISKKIENLENEIEHLDLIFFFQNLVKNH